MCLRSEPKGLLVSSFNVGAAGAASVLFFNGDGVFMPSPTHLASLEAVVAEAELCKQPRAAWLPPYKLEVAPGIFVTLRDKAIRDPFDGATRVVTVRVSA